MKLRLRGDSLRLRLTQTEVLTVRDQGAYEEATTLGASSGPRLAYRVESSPSGPPSVQHTADARGTTVTVILPAAGVATWADSPSQVGIYFDEPWGLKVAVEKDFRCLDPDRDEDESDNFTNPNEGHPHLDTCDSD
jgi:hypothetical protein